MQMIVEYLLAAACVLFLVSLPIARTPIGFVTSELSSDRELRKHELEGRVARRDLPSLPSISHSPIRGTPWMPVSLASWA